jgi:hypothetical protein
LLAQFGKLPTIPKIRVLALVCKQKRAAVRPSVRTGSRTPKD